ncbi:MAG: ABC transporter ATP-binding protein [Proteobacteria bacterium]|nr:ABC transporter ATP-binding protein [Pseudomonadota bacterium]
MAILQTVGLGKDYGDVVAVEALDLTVEAGQLTALLGPNGAGKTTAISMICGIVPATRGNVCVAGHDIATEPFAARRALGLVPQDLALYDELTARQNLTFFGRLYGLSGTLARQRIAWALEVAGLTGRADSAVSRFSGGMKRRLNLVAALLHKPRLLILDEPTVGVDPQSRNHIFETIRALNRDHGMTVIYTSHYMEEVQSLCDRVAIMDHGRIVALDSVDHLIATHAAPMVEIGFEGDANTVEQALAAVGIAGPGVTVADGTAQFPHGHRLGAAFSALEREGTRLRSVHTQAADLESVFLALTGHRLRDD